MGFAWCYPGALKDKFSGADWGLKGLSAGSPGVCLFLDGNL